MRARTGGLRFRREVGAALVAVLIARTAINGGVRVVYPFLPEIARGLGVSLGVASALVALRSSAGLAAPLAARAAERIGRRLLMVIAVGATVGGTLAVAAAPGLAVAAAGFVLIGLAKPAFDVPMQAWFGARVPYARRGRVLGITELTWSLGLLVTVPVSGVLITRFGWRSPFLLVTMLAGVGAVAVWAMIAGDRPSAAVRHPLRLTRARVDVLAVVALFSAAAELMFVVYGAWLEQDLGLTVTAIGVFTLVVVAAELLGEAGVAAISDRVGLKRMILGGLVVSAIAYAGLGAVGGSLALAIAAVVVWFIAFEVTIVATIPFVSELAVESRDRLLSLMVVMIAAGRGVAAIAAPVVFARGGIAGNGALAAGLVVVAAVLLARVPSPAAAQ